MIESTQDALGHAETIVGVLRDCAENCPDTVFLEFSGDEYTYRAVFLKAASLARGLRSAGLGPGDTIVTMLDNNIDGVTVWFAANLLGAISVPINTALKGEFLRHVVADSGARIVIAEVDFIDRFEVIRPKLDELELTVARTNNPQRASRPGWSDLATYYNEGDDHDWFVATPTDISCLVYTGGTTGPSKGCSISHGYVLQAATAVLAQTGRRADELNWSPLPIFHYNVICCTIVPTMLLRGTASIAPRFSVSGFWPEVVRTGAQVVNLLGSMCAFIAQMPDTSEMVASYGQIRVVHGAPFPADLQRTWQERFGVQRAGAGAYGLTECFPLTTSEVGDVAPPGTSGRLNAANFDVRIFDDDDIEVGTGEVGEVVCRPRRPDVMFQGYWRRPEAMVAVTKNLWFHTGDLGMFDEQGFFHFVDRKKDYLRRRGENISSQELEATFIAHPQIAEVAVHAVPSEATEDDVKVTAVLTDGASLTPAELFEWSKDRVPYFALPRYIEFRPQLPVSPLGRVHKFLLREQGCTPDTWDRDFADVTWERR